MIYVLCGEEPYLIEKKLKELVESKAGEKINFNGDNWDELAMQCQEISLLAPARSILVKDPAFLIGKYDEKKLKSLLDYCKKPNFETDLLFYSYDNSFDLRLKIAKEILSNAQLLRFDRSKEAAFRSYIHNRINELCLVIDKDSIDLLIKMTMPSISLLERNLEILAIYPEKIDRNVIASLCTALNEETIFDFINLLIAKNFNKAFKLAKRLMKDNSTVVSFVAVLASQLRFIYEVGYFASKGMNKEKIAETMNVSNPYRITKTMEKLQYLNRKEILHLLNELAILEYDLKSSNTIDENFLFEMFMMEFTK